MRPRTSDHFESLTGSLLLAHPSMQDPHFRRSVILMSSHDAEGAMGVVLNRPLGKKLGQLNPSFALGPLADVPLFSGGPVQPEQLVICAWRIHPEGDGFRLYFGIDPDKAAELGMMEGMHLRAFVGYAGWQGGQLENELGRDTWVVSPVPVDLLDYKQDDHLWRGVLGALNFEWKLLADEPSDPEVN